MTESWKNWEGKVVDGQFHLRRFLGATDRSAVFLTECPAQESQIAAVKFILADPDTGEVQLTRWRLAAKLSHPNLARIYGSGRCLLGHMSLLYVLMEYAEEDLAQILPQRALTQREVRELLPSVLDALSYLHAEGFIHSRLKPANIMAVGDKLKISSDGVRRAAKSGANQSKPTPYDSPEAATGAISPAGDVWSLGMTLVEILTQRLPVWEHFRDGDPSLPDTLPVEFHDLARHCLRRDPALRWTLADVARWLNPAASALQSRPFDVLPENSSQQTSMQLVHTPPKIFANWRYMIPAAAMALILIAMLAGSRHFTRRMEAHPAPSSSSKHADSQPKSAAQPKFAPSADSVEASLRPPSPALPPTVTGKPKSSENADEASAPATTPAPAALKSPESTNSPASGFVPGRVLEQALPEVSQKARNSIRGTVRVGVRAKVDSSGTVTGATLDSPGPSKYFSEQTLHATPRWKFFPATVNGQNVSSEWILRFEFTNAATIVHPSQITP